MRLLFLVGVFFLISSSFVSPIVSNISEEDCIQGNGQWIVPSFDKEPFCQCGNYLRGYPSEKWNGTDCVEITQEDICLRSNGIWMGTECVCEGGEWIPDIGCQFVVHESYTLLIIFILIVFCLIIIATIYLIWLIKNKRKKR